MPIVRYQKVINRLLWLWCEWMILYRWLSTVLCFCFIRYLPCQYRFSWLLFKFHLPHMLTNKHGTLKLMHFNRHEIDAYFCYMLAMFKELMWGGGGAESEIERMRACIRIIFVNANPICHFWFWSNHIYLNDELFFFHLCFILRSLFNVR